MAVVPNKKKDPARIMVENLPKQELTQPAPKSAPVAPVKRIDLTNDPNFKKYASKAFERADVEDYKRKSARLENNELVLGDTGRRITGTFEELMAYKKAWDSLKGLKNPEIEQEKRAEIQSELDKAALKKQMEAEAKQPTVSQEQLSTIGKISEEEIQKINENPVAQEIMRKADLRKQESLLTADRLTAGNVISPIVSPNKFISPISDALKKVLGVDIINIAGQNEKVREYLEDYKMDDEYSYIQRDIKDSISIMKASISEAGTGGDDEEILATYNAAWNRLAAAESQLKAIEQSDQREYVDAIKNTRARLLDMMNKDYKVQMDRRMYKKLNQQLLTPEDTMALMETTEAEGENLG